MSEATDAQRLIVEARQVLTNAAVRPVQAVLDELADALESTLAEKQAAEAERDTLVKVYDDRVRQDGSLLTNCHNAKTELAAANAHLLEQNRVLEERVTYLRRHITYQRYADTSAREAAEATLCSDMVAADSVKGETK